jgi:hypothetical protein
MKPSVGRWVHHTDADGVVRAALIVVCAMKDGYAVGVDEQDFDVTLEVHGLRDHESNVYIVEQAQYSPARSGHVTARGCWTWPARES